MTPRIYKKLAIMSTVALGIAFMATSAKAQTTFESATPETVNINAEVLNSIVATVVEPDLGNLGVLAGLVATEVAVLTIDPDGTIDTSAAVDVSSRIVSDGTAVPGSVTIAAGAAFNNTAVYVTYANAVDLTCGGCASTTDLILTNILDDLGTGLGTACPSTTAVAGSLLVSGPTAVQGCATTSATGELAFNIGYTIETVAGASTRPIYDDGTYLGSVDVTVEY